MKKSICFLFFLATMHLCFAQEIDSTLSSLKKKKNKYTPNISGLIQAHYFNEFNTNGDSIRDPDGFRILRARVELKGKVNKYTGYELMFDVRAPEPRGMLRDAFIVFHLDKIGLNESSFLYNQKIRVGQQKTQFGWENRISSSELYTVNRAEMSDGVSRGENLRDIGIGLIGFIPIKEGIYRFENALTLVNGTRFNVAGPFDFNTKFAFWGRIGLGYMKNELTASLGGSIGAGGLRYLNEDVIDPSDDVYADFERYGVDLQVDHKYFFLAAEYAQGTDTAGDTLFGEPVGYQVELALKTKWKLGPLARYDTFEDDWKVWTLGVFYGFPKDNFRILINYVMRGNVIDEEEGYPNGHDDRLYIQMQVVF